MAGLAMLLASGILGWSMLVAGATADGAHGPRTIVVTGDGSGDATTVAGGVAIARDGDTVLVGPGTYRERVHVDADVEIRGVGLRDAVIVEAPDDPGRHHDGSPRSVAFTFRGSFGSLSNLTVLGRAGGRAISVEAGAAPAISDVVIDATGPAWTGENVAVWWSDGASGVLRDSTVTGIVGMSGPRTAPVIEYNRLPHGCIVVPFDGTDRGDQPRPVIRENAIAGCPSGVLVRVEAGTPVVEGNDLVAPHGIAVSLSGVAAGTVRDNTIHDSGTGIVLAHPRGPVTVTGNTVRDSQVGIRVHDGGPSVRLTGNTLCGNAADLKVVPAGHDVPSLDGNEGCQASVWSPGA